MPKNKKAWSSWNSSVNKDNNSETSITYWLNLLQNLNKKKKYIFIIKSIFTKLIQKNYK